MLKYILMILVVAILSGCAGIASGSTSGAGETNAVYETLIESMFIGEGVEQVVINAQTATDYGYEPGQLEWLQEQFPALSDETLESFSTANQEPGPVPANLDLPVKTVLLPQADFETFFNADNTGGGWDGFYQIYPGAQGIMTLSRPGFNAAGDQALVYVGNQAGWLAGGGHYVFLEKVDGEWQVSGEIMTWIS